MHESRHRAITAGSVDFGGSGVVVHAAMSATSATKGAICPYALNAAKSLPSAIARSLLAAILFLALGAAHGAEWVVEGRVVGISDGDTITVLDDARTQHKIRFAGIDAPEKGQAFGE
jgi:endonuclease YncB( thermonuclease family)